MIGIHLEHFSEGVDSGLELTLLELQQSLLQIEVVLQLPLLDER